MVPELENYFDRIEDLRSQVSGLITALPEQGLNWRPIEGKDDHASNSLAVLARHIAGAEHYWMAEVVGGWPETRDREAEFATIATEASEIVRSLEKTAQETREVFSSLRETDLKSTRQVKGHTVTVRWCILHVIDHTALHLGHMQITYQLWSGGRTMLSPLWFERLPPNQNS